MPQYTDQNIKKQKIFYLKGNRIMKAMTKLKKIMKVPKREFKSLRLSLEKYFQKLI